MIKAAFALFGATLLVIAVPFFHKPYGKRDKPDKYKIPFEYDTVNYPVVCKKGKIYFRVKYNKFSPVIKNGKVMRCD